MSPIHLRHRSPLLLGEKKHPHRVQRAVENVHPLYHISVAILHMLGLDYERLSFEHNGIQRRMTNVEGKVIREVLA